MSDVGAIQRVRTYEKVEICPSTRPLSVALTLSFALLCSLVSTFADSMCWLADSCVCVDAVQRCLASGGQKQHTTRVRWCCMWRIKIRLLFSFATLSLIAYPIKCCLVMRDSSTYIYVYTHIVYDSAWKVNFSTSTQHVICYGKSSQIEIMMMLKITREK